MPTGYESNLTEEQQNELIQFYLQPNTLNRTAKQFNVTPLYVRKLLSKFNITEHSRETTLSIRNKYSRETCLEKYGTTSGGWSQAAQEKIKKQIWRNTGQNLILPVKTLK